MVTSAPQSSNTFPLEHWEGCDGAYLTFSLDDAALITPFYRNIEWRGDEDSGFTRFVTGYGMAALFNCNSQSSYRWERFDGDDAKNVTTDIHIHRVTNAAAWEQENGFNFNHSIQIMASFDKDNSDDRLSHHIGIYIGLNNECFEQLIENYGRFKTATLSVQIPFLRNDYVGTILDEEQKLLRSIDSVRCLQKFEFLINRYEGFQFEFTNKSS